MAKVKNAWLTAGKLGPTMGKPGRNLPLSVAVPNFFEGGDNPDSSRPNRDSLSDKRQRQREMLEEKEAERKQRNEEAKIRAEEREQEARKKEAFGQLRDAAQRDFDLVNENLNRANEDRRSRIEESEDYLRDNVDQTQSRTNEFVRTADQEATRMRDEFEADRKKILKSLETRNQEFQADVIGGITTGLQNQLSQVDQRLAAGEIGEAEAAELKRQVRQQGSSQAAQIAGRAENDFQQLFAQTSTSLSAQGTQVRNTAANMRLSARFQRQQDMAGATLAAASGFQNTARIMFEPDRMLSEVDAMLSLASAEETFDNPDVGRFTGNRRNSGDELNDNRYGRGPDFF